MFGGPNDMYVGNGVLNRARLAALRLLAWANYEDLRAPGILIVFHPDLKRLFCLCLNVL